MAPKRALITGITGQDGSYLAELLLSKGYNVFGIIRRSSSFNTERIDHIFDKLTLFHGDLTDSSNLSGIIADVLPHEVYNLGAQSHVKVSFEVPEYTADVDGIGTMRLLDAIHKYCEDARFYQASTSEMFGGLPEEMPGDGYNEECKFHPRSPYGAAKLYAYWITRNYREAYGIHASNGILFNHEGSRRGMTFVTRKITSWIGKNYRGLTQQSPIKPLVLGNIDAMRDWGHAKDYVNAMWLMLQQDEPDDYVIATGETYSVRDFLVRALEVPGIEIEWKGSGVEEKGYCKQTGRLLVEIDPKYFRPSEVEVLLGNPTKAKEALKWEPKYSFDDLVRDMTQKDISAFNTHQRFIWDD